MDHPWHFAENPVEDWICCGRVKIYQNARPVSKCSRFSRNGSRSESDALSSPVRCLGDSSREACPWTARPLPNNRSQGYALALQKNDGSPAFQYVQIKMRKWLVLVELEK